MKRKQLHRSWKTGAPSHKQTICFAAGHSGGHIIPCLTMAQQKYAAESILFFTSSKQLDCDLMKKSSAAITHIPLSIAQTRRWYTLPLLVCSLAWATVQSFIELIAYMPHRIITTGSIVALPVCIAGWILGIPIELFELNAQPGKTIIGLSYIADTVRHCFAATPTIFARNHCIQTSYPIRFIHPKKTTRIPGFTNDRITLFVQGGSQGSQEINQLMEHIIHDAPDLHARIQIIHQAGAHVKRVQTLYDPASIPAHVFSFESDLSPYYHAADLIICRAGAGALFEALHFKKKTIIIPLITPTNDHQLHNARAMAQEYPELFEIMLQHEKIKTIKQLLKNIITHSQLRFAARQSGQEEIRE